MIAGRFLARQRDRRGIHHTEVLGQHLVIGDRLVAPGVGVFLRVLVIDPVDLGALEDRLAVHLVGAQRGGGVGGENNGLPVPAAKMQTRFFFFLPGGARPGGGCKGSATSFMVIALITRVNTPMDFRAPTCMASAFIPFHGRQHPPM